MMLAYHELSGGSEKDVYSLSQESFRSQAEVVKRLRGGQDCITFDDGHISQFAVAVPVLAELSLSAHFFLTTSWIGGLESVVTWEQVRELERLGHRIGSHSHRHPLLTACDDATLQEEVTRSKKILEDKLGREVDTISLPGGRADARVFEACAEAGYRRVYTSRVGEFSGYRGAPPIIVGRYMVTRATNGQMLTAYLTGEPSTWRRLRIQAAAKTVAKTVVGDSLYQWMWRRAFRSHSYGNW